MGSKATSTNPTSPLLVSQVYSSRCMHKATILQRQMQPPTPTFHGWASSLEIQKWLRTSVRCMMSNFSIREYSTISPSDRPDRLRLAYRTSGCLRDKVKSMLSICKGLCSCLRQM